MATTVFNVYDLPVAYNVCEQELREVLSLSNVSVAHVTMAVDAVSLLHEHYNMTEVYVLTNGTGVLTHGSASSEVHRGASIIIPPKTPHKLKNIGNLPLEHLVFATPPFVADDVYLVDDSSSIVSPPKPYVLNKPPVQALDGVFIYELLNDNELKSLRFSLAIGVLPVGREARLHYHKASEEIYYVMDGIGIARLGNMSAPIKRGSVIQIPPLTTHALKNNGNSQLEILCLSSPTYKDEDFIFP